MNMESIETKQLKITGTPGPITCLYTITLYVPHKQEILRILDQPPYHIYPNGNFSFSTGVLSHLRHRMKAVISRDYQEPFFGLYIDIDSDVENLADITQVQGQFKVPVENRANRDGSVSPPAAAEAGTSDWRTVDCNFYKNATRVNPMFQAFGYYYESRCGWPDQAAKLTVTVQATKLKCATIVCEDGTSRHKIKPAGGFVDIKPFLFSHNCSDVTIEVGDNQFPAHQLILSARSKYFERMFSCGMKESLDRKVKLGDISCSMLKEILHFIYTDEVHDLEENARDLLLLADRYDIEDLAAVCENYLLDQLTVSNALEMYDLSHRAGGRSILAKRSKDLITWHKSDFVSDLETFKEFSNKYPELIFELLRL